MSDKTNFFDSAELFIRTEGGEEVPIGELQSLSIELEDSEHMHGPSGTRWVGYTEEW
jgi:hypothetical protein